jgi:hypothetical protein
VLPQSHGPLVSKSDGSEQVAFSGNNMSADARVVFVSTVGEPLVAPTGYEEQIGGNYDVKRPYLTVSATPLPSPALPPPTKEQLFYMNGVVDSAWRVAYPVFDHNPTFVRIHNASTSLVVAYAKRNHVAGHYARVRVLSPVDRSYLFTDRILIPFYPPTVLELYPPLGL